MFVRGSRWISQRRPVAANGCEHSLGVGNEQIDDEHVGTLRREIVGREVLSREIPQIPSHDRVHTGFDRGSQHMDVVRVWQIETSGTCRVSCHNRIGKVPVHYRAGSFQHVHREIGPVRENATYPLRMDVHAPSRRIAAPGRTPAPGRLSPDGTKPIGRANGAHNASNQGEQSASCLRRSVRHPVTVDLPGRRHTEFGRGCHTLTPLC